MNSLSASTLRFARHGLLAIGALLLAACGPGVGGTGTGAEPAPGLAAVQASDLCTSGLAAALACPAGAASAPGLPTGTAAVDFLNSTTRAQIQGQHIELTLPCQSLNFSGNWGTVGGEAPRFHGTVTSPAANGAAQLEVLAEGDQLRLRLFNPQGQLLLGPLLLQRLAVGAPPPAAPAC